MALSESDKKEIEVTIRKEIKNFLSATTLKKYEDNGSFEGNDFFAAIVERG